MNRIALAALILMVLTVPASAYDLGARAPDKPASTGHPAPPPDPDVVRQGGDTLFQSILISVPGTASGTTAGYADDYDEACPYTDSTAPDVVYKLAPPADIIVDIDMAGSSYDTKIYLYREDFTLVACNDDFYPNYVSKLEEIALAGDVKYFLVIDGYGEEAGDYTVEISEFVPCVLDCPTGFQVEGEPPLVDGYEDTFNGGCNTDHIDPPFSTLYAPFCGVSGWYVGPDGGNWRDTDWFELVLPSWGIIEITGDAEFATYMFELGPMDCGSVAVIQDVVFGPCMESTITIVGEAGSTVWFWVGPTSFQGPVNEYDYILFYWYGEPAVRTEAHSWSAVKDLFH